MAHDPEDYWSNLMLGQQSRTASAIDDYLSGKDAAATVDHTGLRALTDRGREANSLPLPADVGTRVAFISNIGSVLQWQDPPADNAEGTVVMVRTAEGDQTGLNGFVFVKFDDGRFLQVDPQFLRRASGNQKRASAFTRRVSNLGDLTGFLRWGNDDNELVHKATRDLWSFETTDKGEFVISRLFQDNGEPLKV